jgi:hypothetical protein
VGYLGTPRSGKDPMSANLRGSFPDPPIPRRVASVLSPTTGAGKRVRASLRPLRSGRSLRPHRRARRAARPARLCPRRRRRSEPPNASVRSTPAKLPNAPAPARVAFEARPHRDTGRSRRPGPHRGSSGATCCGGGPTASRPRDEFVLGEGERLVHPQPGASSTTSSLARASCAGDWPPRLPAVGRARPALVRARPLRRADRAHAPPRPGLERRLHRTGAPGPEARDGRLRAPPARGLIVTRAHALERIRTQARARPARAPRREPD